jgi:glycosyltransferase involved in cell wall biosynthesis
MDTESISTALNRLIEDETLRQDLARKGLERSKRFTWERAATETWTVYAELLSRRFLNSLS